MTGKTREDHLAVPEPAAPGRNIIQPLGIDPGHKHRCFDYDLIVMDISAVNDASSSCSTALTGSNS